jgi:glycosyltransferase involved in cell wall biosynthesis
MEYYYKTSSNNYHLPAFIDTHFFEKEPKYDQKYRLGYFGTFGQKDHVEGIIEAFKISKQFIPELQLCLMGAVPKKLKNLYASKDLSGLSFVEDIHYHDLNEKLQTCDLLISNRDKSEYSQFGFPTKLIEYLASGIPVISTRVSDIASYFQHEKELYLIEPNNPKELSKAILSRYHNFHSFNEMAQRGKQKVFKTHSQTLLNNWRTFTQSLN